MSNFKSPELIVNGKLVKVLDTSSNEVPLPEPIGVQLLHQD